METFTLAEYGDSTSARQEKFTVRVTLTDVDVSESYVLAQDGANYNRKIKFDTKFSEPHLLGQTVDLLSSWQIRVTSASGDADGDGTSRHASVGWGPNRIYADTRSILCKFQISIVDADGDVLYARKWRSFDKAKKLGVGDFYSMPDFIALDELLISRDFLMLNKTLHLKCEGVIYSQFENSAITKITSLPRPLTQMGPNLFEKWQYADVELISRDNQTLMAHKIVLTEASPRFAYLSPPINAQGCGNKMEKVYLDELSTDEMKKLREFIYTGAFNQDWDELNEVTSLIRISKEFEIPSMKQYCFLKMLDSLSVTNFLDKLGIYFKNSAGPRIQLILHNFFIRHQDKFVELDRFKKFAENQKDAFLFVAIFKGS